MRVTPSISYRNLLDSINGLNSELERSSLEVSSGKRLAHLRDSPSDSARLVELKKRLSEIDQFKSNSESASFFLGMTDSTLSSAFDTMTTIYTRGSSAGAGSKNASNMAALASEVRALRDELLSQANTKVDGRYLFSGSLVTTAAFSIAGDTVTYQGDAEVNRVTINDGSQIRLNVAGSAAFSAVFADIEALVVAIDNNDQAGISAALAGFKASQDALGVVRAQVGTDLGRSRDVNLVHESHSTELKKLQVELEGADLAESVSRMARAENTLTAALASGAALNRRNLFDFLA